MKVDRARVPRELETRPLRLDAAMAAEVEEPFAALLAVVGKVGDDHFQRVHPRLVVANVVLVLEKLSTEFALN